MDTSSGTDHDGGTGLRGGDLRAVLEQAGAGSWSSGDGGGIRATFSTGDFRAGLELVAAIGELAEAAGHHPDVLLTYPRVVVTLISHDVESVTRRDLDLAAQITRAAADRGVEILPG